MVLKMEEGGQWVKEFSAESLEAGKGKETQAPWSPQKEHRPSDILILA